MIRFVVSRDIKDYKSILEGLINDFGYSYWHAILIWCKVLDEDNFDSTFWKIWLISDNNKIIGICGLYSHYPDDNKELWLGWFGILPEYRKSGIGTKALDFMIKKAKKSGCIKILSYVDKNGKPLGFYYKNGFKLIGRAKDYIKQNPQCNKNEFQSMRDYIIEKEI